MPPGVCGLQTLTLIATWKTKVDVCLITDNEAALQNVLNRWAFPGVQVCSFSTPIVEQWWIYNGQNRTVEAKWNLVVRIISRVLQGQADVLCSIHLAFKANDVAGQSFGWHCAKAVEGMLFCSNTCCCAQLSEQWRQRGSCYAVGPQRGVRGPFQTRCELLAR